MMSLCRDQQLKRLASGKSFLVAETTNSLKCVIVYASANFVFVCSFNYSLIFEFGLCII